VREELGFAHPAGFNHRCHPHHLTRVDVHRRFRPRSEDRGFLRKIPVS
jgi:hypothetical protein